ncbi:hypothetical protein GGR89_002969 [Sphingomonas trueperi]|uniref:Uncharacterized protein n=1 Tax=Sphingomonas trueperi TaxID=53317 RepID=A0A7X5Y073_9SPHN|nr:hypothetical protein [Sphingomonas trueperi]
MLPDSNAAIHLIGFEIAPPWPEARVRAWGDSLHHCVSATTPFRTKLPFANRPRSAMKG